MAVELQGCAASSRPSAPRWIWVPAPTEGGEMMLEESGCNSDSSDTNADKPTVSSTAEALQVFRLFRSQRKYICSAGYRRLLNQPCNQLLQAKNYLVPLHWSLIPPVILFSFNSPAAQRMHIINKRMNMSSIYVTLQIQLKIVFCV